MKILGYKRSNFTSNQGTLVTGIKIYASYPLTGEDADGLGVDSLYMTDDKLAKCGYVPHVGDEVQVTYNRYGKPAAIIPARD